MHIVPSFLNALFTHFKSNHVPSGDLALSSITSVAKEQFNRMIHADGLPLKQRTLLLTQILQSLIQHRNQQLAHQPFLFIVAYWLGIKSLQEHSLDQFIQTVEDKIQHYLADAQSFEKIIKTWDMTNQRLLQTKEKVLHFFHYNVLERTPLYIGPSHTFSHSQTCLATLNDLKTFQQTQEVQDPTLEQAIEELKFTYRLALALDSIQSPTIDKKNVMTILNEMADEILFGFKILLKQPKGPCIVIPGGVVYGSEGHAVLYVIKKENEQEISFSIFNSGEGAALIEKEQIVLLHEEKLNEQFNLQNSSIKEIKNSLYQWISLNQYPLQTQVKARQFLIQDLNLISKSFLVELLFFMTPHKGASNMQEVNQFIDKHFANCKEQVACTHKLQRKKSCTLRVQRAWLQQRTSSYTQFKIWVTEQDIQRLSDLTSIHIKNIKGIETTTEGSVEIYEGSPLLQRCKKASLEVLKKRKEKT